MITMHSTTRRATSEGTLSARQINRAALTPDPYLLSSPPRKAPAPLRLIKPAKPGPDCGFGSCSVTPECTSGCSIRQAEEALRGHYGRLHTQRQDMPPTPAQVSSDHRGRRITWALLIAWCLAALCLGVWVAVRALLTA